MNDNVQTQSDGKSKWYPPVISLTMISVENGVLAAAAKKPAMPTMTKLAGCGTRPRPEVVHHHPQGAAAASADDHRRSEHAARAAAADRQARRENLPQGDGQEDTRGHAGVLRHGVLDRRVAEGKHGQHLLSACPDEVHGKVAGQRRRAR